MDINRTNQLPSQDVVDGVAPVIRPPRRARHWGRVISKSVGGLLLLVLVAVLIYAGYIAFNVAKISTQPLQLSGLQTDANGRVNILVLGVGDPGHDGEGLSDTM
jgi:hypothetical protein